MPVGGRSCVPVGLPVRNGPGCSNTASSWPLGGVTPGAPPALPALPDRPPAVAADWRGVAPPAPPCLPTPRPPPPPAVAADWRALPLPAHRCLQRPCRPTRGNPGQSNPTDVMHNDQSTYQLTYDELIGHTT